MIKVYLTINYKIKLVHSKIKEKRSRLLGNITRRGNNEALKLISR